MRLILLGLAMMGLVLCGLGVGGCAQDMTPEQRQRMYAVGMAMQQAGQNLVAADAERRARIMSVPIAPVQVNPMPDYMAQPVQVKVQQPVVIPQNNLPSLLHY